MKAKFIGADGSMGLRKGRYYSLIIRLVDFNDSTDVVKKLNSSIQFGMITTNNDIRAVLNMVISPEVERVCESGGCFYHHPITLSIENDKGEMLNCPYGSVIALFENWKFEDSMGENSIIFKCDTLTNHDEGCYSKNHKKCFIKLGIIIFITIIISEVLRH